MGSHQVHFTGADYYALVSIVIGTVTALDILFHRGSTFRLVRQNKWLWFLGCAATYVIVLSPFFTLAYILFCHHKMVRRRGPRPARGGRGGGYGLPESGTSRPGYGSDWMKDMSRTCSSCGGRKTQRCIGRLRRRRLLLPPHDRAVAALAERWNGRNWAIQAAPSPADALATSH